MYVSTMGSYNFKALLCEYLVKYIGNQGKYQFFFQEIQGNITMKIIKYRCFPGNPGKYAMNLIKI